MTAGSPWAHAMQSVRRKRPEKWRDGHWILHHDNMPAHTSHLVQQFLAKHGTAQLQLPPYSPHLAPCDFFLFPRLKKVLKGHRSEATEDIRRDLTEDIRRDSTEDTRRDSTEDIRRDSTEDIRRDSTKTLLDIPKEEFAKCFQQWQKRWAKCVAAEENYVEANYG